MKTWKGYQKCVNLGGWFSQCDYSEDRFNNFITEDDFKELTSWGLDHLRLPVDYNLVETEDGQYKEEGFARIKRALELGHKYGFNMILDLHKTAGYSFDPGEKQSGFFGNEALQERFYRLWEEFAKRFGGYGDKVAFELLNEVVDKEDGAVWAEIAPKCVERIRAYAPTTDILIGGYWHNSVQAVRDIPMPMDEHIIYNFHSYDPLLFTHQGAQWVDDMPADYHMEFKGSMEDFCAYAKAHLPAKLAGTLSILDYKGNLDSAYFEDLFADAIAVAKERNVALYCGEYGVIENADPANTVLWYKAIHEVFVKYGIGRAAWSYKEMDFDLRADRLKPVFAELKKYF